MDKILTISVTEFSPHWETSEIEVDSKYKAGTGEEIKARIGLHIGLKGVNITLKGTACYNSTPANIGVWLVRCV